MDVNVVEMPRMYHRGRCKGQTAGGDSYMAPTPHIRETMKEVAIVLVIHVIIQESIPMKTNNHLGI